jgi:hypothetical protein
MTQPNQNALKKLKRKYPGLPVVGSHKDWERIEKMLSKKDLELYKLITKRGKTNDNINT